MNMYPYTPPTQVYTMHPHYQHQHHHHHHQQHQHQAMYAQQHQQANQLLYQYNQLHTMHSPYPTAPIRYAQQPMDQHQPYRTDQLVPQSSAQVTTPVQQHLQRPSPVDMLRIPSPDTWLNGSSLKNPDVFAPILRAMSNTMVDAVSYNTNNNNIGNPTTTPLISIPFESPNSSRHHRSKRQSSYENHHHRRQRLHSGSSCYESDSPVLSSNDDDEHEWRPVNSKRLATMSSPSKQQQRSRSMGRPDLMNNDQQVNDMYQPSFNNNGLFRVINPAAVSNTNHYSSTKSNNIISRPKLFQYIEENIIGKDYIFHGPWGLRRMIYCDYTASGRPLQFIENYISTYVLPLYGNTHSETSLCAQQSTKFREEARKIIKKSVNAKENDILLFTGTGSTGAIHTLVDNFDLYDEYTRDNTVVIVSAFEHHSNILPWKETGVEMARIATTQHGILDKSDLKEKLQYYFQLNKRIICSLNAASNISGILTDVDDISALVHSYSGLIFWDYATAAPYVKIDMNPSVMAYKDAIFISTHKLVGGPGAPGILIAKKYLFSLKAPKSCGGGTVNFVTRTSHEYNYDIETREEGGTPNIIGCIRAGLVFQLKDSIDIDYLQEREDELVKRFNRRFKKNNTLILLGSSTAVRLPIFSFIIYVPGICKYLHHNFVCLLLNDLFGIQVRSGCACAGPYALDLLNVDDEKTDIYCRFMTEDTCARVGSENEQIVRTMMMKPGFTRLNLSFFANDDEIEYVLNAVQFIASEGWKFLPFYTYDPVIASWHHRTGFQLAQSSLEDITYKSGKMQYSGNKKDLISSRAEKMLTDPFREAKLIAADALHRAVDTIDYTSDPPLNVPDKYKHMVWFALPIDIAVMIDKQKVNGQEVNCHIDSIPFIPSDAKTRIVNSTGKTNELPNSGDTSNNRKKRNLSRASSTFRVRS